MVLLVIFLFIFSTIAIASNAFKAWNFPISGMLYKVFLYLKMVPFLLYETFGGSFIWVTAELHLIAVYNKIYFTDFFCGEIITGIPFLIIPAFSLAILSI